MRLQLLLFLSSCVQLQAQDWQTVYNQSTKAFADQKYEEAITLSEKALTLSKDDIKSWAYSSQILTASSLEVNRPEIGLKHISKEIELFARIEPSGKNYAEAMHKRCNLLLMSGKSVEASVFFNDALGAMVSAYGDQSYQYFTTLAGQAQAFFIIGKLEEAQKNYDKCLISFPTFEDGGEDYLYSLFYSASIDQKLNKKESAGKKFNDFILLAEKNNLTQLSEYSQAKEMIAALEKNGNSVPIDVQQKLTELLKLALQSQKTNINEAKLNYQNCEKLIGQYNIDNNIAFSCLINYGRLLFNTSEYSEAKIKLSIARQLIQKLGQESEQHGYANTLEADIMLHTGAIAEAIPMYQLALKCFKNSNPEIRFQQIKEIADRLYPFNDGESLKLLEATINSEEYKKAEIKQQVSLFRLYAKICVDSKRSNQLVSFMNLNPAAFSAPELKQLFFMYSGIGYGAAGNYEKAVELINESLKIKIESDVIPELHYELARHQQLSGEYIEAENNYRKAISLVNFSDENLAAQVYNSFATFYIQLGNYKSAEKLFNDLLKNKNLPKVFQNTILQNVASIYEQTGRYKEAKVLLIKVAKEDELSLGKNNAEYGITLQNLALVYQKMGRLDSAQLLMERALDIDKKIYGESSLIYATKIANLAALYQDSHNFAKAQELFERSLAIRKKFLSADHPDYTYNLYSLAYLFYRTQHSTEALPLFRETASYYIKQIKEVFPALSEYERTVFYNKIQPVITAYQSYMVENIGLEEKNCGDLFDFRLETKALLLNSSIKARNHILNSGNPSLINKFAVWQHTKEQLTYLYTLNITERQKHGNLMNEYEEKANQLEKSLSLESEDFASSFDQTPVDWKKIQQKLEPDEAAVEIMRINLPKKDSIIYAAIILKQTGRPLLITLPNSNLENREFKRYFNSIKFKVEDRTSYNIYWKRIAESLGGIKQVYLSPDGVYNKINCLTLYDPATKQFLIEKLNIKLITNLKDLLLPRQEFASANKALLIGAPDFRLDVTENIADIKQHTEEAETFFQLLQGGINELPGTSVEVAKIGEILKQNKWSADVYTREKATEELIKTVTHSDILHIATHGFFIAADENTSQVFDASLSNIKSNSMLRSGLLLAGAEKNLIDKLQRRNATNKDDGVLTALEVMNLNLDKTSLVILSACETAGGDVRNGEGVYGLQRAFLLAGAKSLLMSLWKVDDAATQELMVYFYTYWINGDDKNLAFRKAQLEIKNKFVNPYYWGAFVLVGNQ